MIGVALIAHKLEIQVMNTANTPPTQKLLKTQRAVMRELRRGSFLNVYIIHFPLFFFCCCFLNNKWLCKGNKLSKKSYSKVIMELGLNQEQEKHLSVLKSLPATERAVARMWELWLASSVSGGCQAFNLLLLENILSYLLTGVKIGNKVILILDTSNSPSKISQQPIVSIYFI